MAKKSAKKSARKSVKKSAKATTKQKAVKTMEVRLKADFTEQDLLDKVPTLFKKLKTSHPGSGTTVIEFHKQIGP
jgi:hypothetical protein